MQGSEREKEGGAGEGREEGKEEDRKGSEDKIDELQEVFLDSN